MSYTILTSQVRPYSITTLREHTRVSTNDFDSELRRSWYAATSDIEKRTGILLRQCTVRGDLLGSPDGYVFPVGPVTDLAGITMTNQETGAVLTQGRTGDYIVDMTNQNPTVRVMDRSKFSDRNVPFSTHRIYLKTLRLLPLNWQHITSRIENLLLHSKSIKCLVLCGVFLRLTERPRYESGNNA